MLPRATDGAEDERLRTLRKDKKVAAVLHDGYPVRYWDHDLGPDAPHLLGWHFRAGDDVARSVEVASLSVEHLKVQRPHARRPGHALGEAEFDLSPDGTFVVSTWRTPTGRGAYRTILVRIDVDSQQRTVLVDDPDADLGSPVISTGRDRRRVRARVDLRRRRRRRAGRCELLALSGDRGQGRAAHARRRTGTAGPPATSGCRTARACSSPPTRTAARRCSTIDLATDTVTQLTNDDYCYSDLQVAPDASVVYALRASYLAPAHPVRIHLVADENRPRGTVTVLRAPAPPPTLPGRLTEVRTTVGDGDDAHEVRGWLALPDDAPTRAPAPLLLWIHGGPLGSWNTWSWRWNPWLMVAKGYAVLLPDPALSTGYGQDFIQRGWGRWGAEPVHRPDGDHRRGARAAATSTRQRTAAMGGSFGGYMANWVAGQTDRFDAIVTHASLWALDQFGPTTDLAFYWGREMTPEMAQDVLTAPQRRARSATPMLVVHGDKDYRVPIGEGLRLWYDLLSRLRPARRRRRDAPSTGSCTSRTRTTGCSARSTRSSGTRSVLGFLAEHVLAKGCPVLPETLG